MTIEQTHPHNDPPRHAYSVDGFCRTIGIGRTKFYELVRERKIRTVTIGGRRLVPATEIQRLLGNVEVANEAR
jgi:excisionase family DNA binding protein